MKGGNMKPNRIVMKVYGKYALFTDPMTKIGGEKSSMMIPSYETLKGIVCGNYWKPSINWIIESVKVLNPIRTERKGIRPIKYNGGNDLSYYTPIPEHVSPDPPDKNLREFYRQQH